jgi:hypothetical protein
MKATNLTVAVLAVLAPLTAAPAPSEVVPVCVSRAIDSATIAQAEIRAARLLRRAKLTIDFHREGSKYCMSHFDGVILVSFSQATAGDLMPGALGYALPYEGVHIAVFWDRLQMVKKANSATLLAYVLVHEITHILKGAVRHSDTGVMKAQWGETEYGLMNKDLLPLSSEDIRLIHQGVRGRRLWAGRVGMSKFVEPDPRQ